jgi:hypothetical protein
VQLEQLLATLEHDGVLLLSDPLLPSVATLVAGGPIGGSWWGHPRGGEIYHLSNQLEDDPDVLVTKLVSAKVTFVHRRLWPAVVAVGQSRATWQMDGLSEAALWLLGQVDESGHLGWDDIPSVLPPDNRKAKIAVHALEPRLLVHMQELHTPTGAHAKELTTWARWAATTGTPRIELDAGTQELEAVLDDLNRRYSAAARLPWQARARSRTSAVERGSGCPGAATG